MTLRRSERHPHLTCFRDLSFALVSSSTRLELQAVAMAACGLNSSDKKISLLMRLTAPLKKIGRIPALWERHAWSIGREDPRRAIHALKAGTALALVSLLYILEPFFKGIGKNAMWAVMTVVVVLEFTAGATICKGLNRGLGTVMAGSLAFLIELVAARSGKVFRAFFVGASVFLIGFAATYLRFFPSIKKNYDYGVVIFLLTFNLITVSSFREEDVMPLARDRLSTIAIGCAICLFMSLLVLPNWSGEDLHNCTVRKFEGLATSIEACVNEYFREKDKDGNVLDEQAAGASIGIGYRAVLDSKSSDETLAHYASWEPRHSMRCYSYPWQKYVKLGSVLRHFAYTVAALHGCLESEIQTPPSVRSLFRDPCTRVAREVAKVLQELALSIRSHRRCAPDVLSDHLHEALQDLNSAIRSQPRLFLGSKHACAANRRMLMELNSGKHTASRATLHSFKTDTASLSERKNTKTDQPPERNERSMLRPTLSKIAITSLEFSEALSFAAFASLLVEMVVRLELVIEEVKNLEGAANFREFTGHDHLIIDLTNQEKMRNTNGAPLYPVSTAAE
ncbi:aluminum-activated malate transporter 12-like [Phragmites australis]|uniref:aluminum-activated malate transporter 12-like n=1 Tax=Phragmites australis TaxID=29695 RepID=UPI002D77D1F0|nr:aluminum-activated malate transporter 12-like [Phragmites australis]